MDSTLTIHGIGETAMKIRRTEKQQKTLADGDARGEGAAKSVGLMCC